MKTSELLEDKPIKQLWTKADKEWIRAVTAKAYSVKPADIDVGYTKNTSGLILMVSIHREAREDSRDQDEFEIKVFAKTLLKMLQTRLPNFTIEAGSDNGWLQGTAGGGTPTMEFYKKRKVSS